MNEQMALFKEEIEKKVKVKEEPKAEIKEEPIDYEEIFEKLDLPNGFKDLKDSYRFYSFTTEVEEVKKDRILAVLGDKNKDRIQTCDEFGCFEHCFGVTEEFCNHLIKQLKLVKTLDGTEEQRKVNGLEFHTEWRNPKIKQDDKAKEIAELKKELAIKKVEMMNTIKKIRGLENEEKKEE
jgi:hypothetical protein